MPNKSPCMNCKERDETCHSKCEKYKSFRVLCEKENKERIKAVEDRKLKFRANKY